ncbi:MAG: hypothetical protein CK532_06115 [Flavobacteriales bacterium]|nr:MAG: hypothetical protein CK532_06115 [Flavobacteriales bacterium]
MNIGDYYIGAPASYGLIAVLAWVFFAGFNDRDLTMRWALSTWMMRHKKQWWRLISSGFVHAGILHILLNALGIYYFGTMVEKAVGSVFTLIIFFLSVLGGGLLSSFLRRKDSDYRALGASGGVMGLLLCAIFWFDGMRLGLFILPIFIPAWIFGIIFIWGSIVLSQLPSKNNVSHEGHLGGAFMGGLIGYLLIPHVAFSHEWWLFWLGVMPIFLFALLQGIFPKKFYQKQ